MKQLRAIDSQIKRLDAHIRDHIKDGTEALIPVARLRAKLSRKRANLILQCMEDSQFDSESTLSGMGHITVETIQ